jgi:hypothetical protein
VLALFTDAYSKRIMGYYVADNMNTAAVLRLLMAIKQERVRKRH